MISAQGAMLDDSSEPYPSETRLPIGCQKSGKNALETTVWPSLSAIAELPKTHLALT